MKPNNCNIIYKLINRVNNKIYIGQTWHSTKKRFKEYRKSSYIYNAIKKYGKDNFYYETLALCSNQNIADYLEKIYIEDFNSRDTNIGYNLKEGGSRGKCAEETKIKISKSAMGHKRNLGRLHSAESKEKMSKAQSGVKSYLFGEKRSVEVKEKISNAHQGEKNPFYGKTHTNEVKDKISKLNKGKTWKIIDGKRVWINKD